MIPGLETSLQRLHGDEGEARTSVRVQTLLVPPRPACLPPYCALGTGPGDGENASLMARNNGTVTCHTQLLVSNISAKKRNQGP